MAPMPNDPDSREGLDGGPPRTAPGSRRRVLIEALVMFGIATGVCAGLWQLRGVSGFINRNLQAFIAAVFLYLPTGLLLRRKEDFAAYGLTVRPVKRGLLLYLAVSAVVFPLFAVGFYVYYEAICAWARRGVSLPAQLRGLCRRYVGGLAGARLRLPTSIELVAGEFLVVALPEEYFFRGYLQTRLEAVWPSRRTFLGARVGYPLLVASALFGLGHLLVDGDALRLAVFFPGLVFGWMRQASGSILAGVLFHASSNLVSRVLHDSFF